MSMSSSQPNLTLPHKRTNSTLTSSNNGNQRSSSSSRGPTLSSISESEKPRISTWTFPRSPSPLTTGGPLSSSPLSAITPISTSRFRVGKTTLARDWLAKLVFFGVAIFFFSALAGTGYDAAADELSGQKVVKEASPSKRGGDRGAKGEIMKVPDVYLPSTEEGEDEERAPRDAYQVVGDSSHDRGEDWVKDSPKAAAQYDDQNPPSNARPIFHADGVNGHADEHAQDEEDEVVLERTSEVVEDEDFGIADGVEHEDGFSASPSEDDEAAENDEEDEDEGTDDDQDIDSDELEENLEVGSFPPSESDEDLLPGEDPPPPEDMYAGRRAAIADMKRSREALARIAAEERERERAKWVAQVRQGRAGSEKEGRRGRAREVR